MPQYLEIDAAHSNIKTTEDLLEVIYDKDRLYRKYYLVGTLISIAVVALIILLIAAFDRDSPEHIKQIIGLEGLSTGLFMVVLFISAIPWLHAIFVHKGVMSTWSSNNKLST